MEIKGHPSVYRATAAAAACDRRSSGAAEISLTDGHQAAAGNLLIHAEPDVPLTEPRPRKSAHSVGQIKEASQGHTPLSSPLSAKCCSPQDDLLLCSSGIETIDFARV